LNPRWQACRRDWAKTRKLTKLLPEEGVCCQYRFAIASRSKNHIAAAYSLLVQIHCPAFEKKYAINLRTIAKGKILNKIIPP